MPITTSVDNDKQLTTYTVVGEASFEEVMTTIKQFHEVGRQTINVLWDLRKAGLARVSSKKTEAMINYIKLHSEKRSGGKTALVASRNLEYGLSRMAEMLNEIKSISIQRKVFRSIKEAIQWLDEAE
jgi:hypothetical protein